MKNKTRCSFIMGVILGMILISSISVFAIEGVKAVINSEEVTYDNSESGGRSENVQGSIDELYERSGILDKEWKDPILNGADPVFDKDGELIPVEIDGKGTVKYANLKTKWYEYEEKRWANAVILTAEGKNKNYKTGDTIQEIDIESYFVWIPRYKYKIWDLGNYDKAYNFSDLKDTADGVQSNSDLIASRIIGNMKLIDVVFGDTKTVQKMQETSATLNEYYTHPAFTLGEKELNGIWVGKFETGYKGATTTIDAQKNEINSDKIIIKPNVYSWRYQTVGKIFKTALGYKKALESHMMKNIEWGALAYLSHSVYGIGTEVNINNNSNCLTGFSAAANTDQSSYPGISGTEDNVTQPWNTSTGYLASTTGNITGVYDMSGGAAEYIAAYMDNYGVTSAANIDSDLTKEDLTNYAKYLDKYSSSSTILSYNNRKLGDATGEVGPFYNYFEKNSQFNHNSWYADSSNFVSSSLPWFGRGGHWVGGVLGGQFTFVSERGSVWEHIGSRLVLAF